MKRKCRRKVVETEHTIFCKDLGHRGAECSCPVAVEGCGIEAEIL
jgi:hypothetical protein